MSPALAGFFVRGENCGDTRVVLVKDPDAFLEKLEKAAKEQWLSFICLKEAMLAVRKSLGTQALRAADYLALYHTGPPATMVIRIPGPVLSLNFDLKGYSPLDRLVYASNREWWRGEVEAALATIPREEWRPFDRAGIIATQSGCDVDNIGIKTLVDTLKDLGVIKDDCVENVPFLLTRNAVRAKASVEVMIVDANAVLEEIDTIYSRLVGPFALPDDSIISSSNEDPFEV